MILILRIQPFPGDLLPLRCRSFLFASLTSINTTTDKSQIISKYFRIIFWL